MSSDLDTIGYTNDLQEILALFKNDAIDEYKATTIDTTIDKNSLA